MCFIYILITKNICTFLRNAHSMLNILARGLCVLSEAKHVVDSNLPGSIPFFDTASHV